jgi:type IX secretion system PorP/SprF family membrane protein
MKKYLFLVMLFLLTTVSYAQNENYDFYGFRLNTMFTVNPAWVTQDDGVNVMLNSQLTGSSFGYAHKNIMAGVYGAVGQNSGLGLKVISDSRGAFQIFRADVSYGFHVRLTKEHSLRLGLLAGVSDNRINLHRADPSQQIDLNDPTLASDAYSTQFVTGAGLVYSFKQLEVSASLPQIISSNRPTNTYLNAAVFYSIKVNNDLTIKPWISYQTFPVTKELLGGYTRASFKNVLWAQVGYQNNKSFASAIGASYDNIGLSYGIRFSNSEFKQIAGQVHEVAITVRIFRDKEKYSSGSGTITLQDVMARIDVLMNQKVTSKNRSELRKELQGIRQMLLKAELDSEDPTKADVVAKQLLEIEEKLRDLEQQLQK